MKILITGGRGQVGSDCEGVLKKAHEVRALGSKTLDITRLSEVEAITGRFSPQIVVNCAGFTRVDDCESQRETAWNVNVKGIENLIRVGRDQGYRIIHISSDYVFDGMKTVPEPYLEDDRPNPLSYYGMTKLEGEHAAERSNGRCTVLRTAWVYGINGQHFLKTMLKSALADPHRELRVVNDQFGSSTWSYTLALQIERLIGGDRKGIYHATAEGYCTWYELAVYFLKKMEVPHNMVPCTSEQYPTPAVRPKNSILENRRLKTEGLNIMRHWKEDLNRFVLKFRDRLVQECKQ